MTSNDYFVGAQTYEQCPGISRLALAPFLRRIVRPYRVGSPAKEYGFPGNENLRLLQAHDYETLFPHLRSTCSRYQVSNQYVSERRFSKSPIHNPRPLPEMHLELRETPKSLIGGRHLESWWCSGGLLRPRARPLGTTSSQQREREPGAHGEAKHAHHSLRPLQSGEPRRRSARDSHCRRAVHAREEDRG